MAQLTMYPAIVNSPPTTITSSIDASTTTIPVAELGVFPDAPNEATLKDTTTPTNNETVRYTAKSAASGAGNLTVVRGWNASGSYGAARSWSSGTEIARVITAYDLDTIKANIEDHETNKAPANPLATDTLWAAKGDLVVGTGDNTAARVAAGSNGQVVVYDSGQSAGVLAKFAKRTVFLSCAGGWPSTTSGDSGLYVTETSTNKVNYKGTKFPASASDVYHEFGCAMPLNWDGGTITFRPVFYTTSTDASSHTVIFSLAAVGLADGDAIDTAYGTAQTSTVTAASSIANLVKIGAESSAITVANTSTGGEWVQFRIARVGSDTHTGDIYLIGALVSYTTDNFSDE